VLFHPMLESPIMYMWFDEAEWVIAESAVEAEKVYADYAGFGYVNGAGAERWEQLVDDTVVKLYCDPSGKPCEIGDGKVTALTAKEWVERLGKGYVGSTEG
jgi:hypothetical protein